jgi:hypothetical protein
MVPVPLDIPLHRSKRLEVLRSLDTILHFGHRESHAAVMGLMTHRYAGLAAALAFVLASPEAVADVRAEKAACFDAAEQGQLFRYNGDLVGARERLMACATTECPVAVAHDCTKWLGEVIEALPSLAIHAKDSRGHDVIGAAVLIDGRRVAVQLGGVAVAINPGAHRIRLETPAGVTYEEKILLVEGQKDRVLDATFPVDLNLDGTRAKAPPVQPEVARGGHTVDAVALAFAAVGVSGIALATYFELAGQSEYRALEKGCGLSGTCYPSAIDSSKGKLYYGAPITFGVGLLSMGTAATVFFLGHHPPSPAASATWQFGVTPLAWGGMMGIAARRF